MHTREVVFPAGKAETVTVNTNLLGLQLKEAVYLLSHKGGIVVVTFAVPASLFAAYRQTFEQSVRSMRYL